MKYIYKFDKAKSYEVIAIILSCIFFVIGYVTTEISDYSKSKKYKLYFPKDALQFCCDQFKLDENIKPQEINFQEENRQKESNKIIIIDHTRSSRDYSTSSSDYHAVLTNFICGAFIESMKPEIRRRLSQLGQKDLILVSLIKIALTLHKSEDLKISIVNFDGTGITKTYGNKWHERKSDCSVSEELPKYIAYLESKDDKKEQQWSNFETLLNDLHTSYILSDNIKDSERISFLFLSDLDHEKNIPTFFFKKYSNAPSSVPHENVKTPIDKILSSKNIDHISFIQFMSNMQESEDVIYKYFITHPKGNSKCEKLTMDRLLNEESLIIKKIQYMATDIENKKEDIIFYKIQEFPFYRNDEYKSNIKIIFPTSGDKPNEPDNFLIKIIDKKNESDGESSISLVSPGLTAPFPIVFNELKCIGLMSGSEINLVVKKTEPDVQKLKIKLYNSETQRCYLYNVVMMSKLSKELSLALIILISLFINFVIINGAFITATFFRNHTFNNQDKTKKAFINRFLILLTFLLLFYANWAILESGWLLVTILCFEIAIIYFFITKLLIIRITPTTNRATPHAQISP
jgi:hypothetical protein